MTATPQALADHFEVPPPAEVAPRFNIAPTQPVLTVSAEDGSRHLVPRHWGLVPSWAKSPEGAGGMINARVETVAEKPAFREAFRARRCLVASDGFFEWRAGSHDKQPYHIALPDRGLFAFAGLYEHWSGAAGKIDSCTIVTTEARGRLRALHRRMPVLLPPEHYGAWLAPDRPAAELRQLMEAALWDRLELRAVSRRVNSIQNDDAACLAPEPQLSLLPDESLGPV